MWNTLNYLINPNKSSQVGHTSTMTLGTTQITDKKEITEHCNFVKL